MTAQALQDAAQAAIVGDPRRGRRVRRTTPLRRTAHDLAEGRIRRSSCARAEGSLARALAGLQCLDEIQRVGELADFLALQVVRGCEHVPLDDVQRDAVRAVSAATVQRLCCLADGLHVPTMDPSYVRCGCDLREALDRLPDDGLRLGRFSDAQATSVTVCAEVARAVLAASRHAGRMAWMTDRPVRFVL